MTLQLYVNRRYDARFLSTFLIGLSSLIRNLGCVLCYLNFTYVIEGWHAKPNLDTYSQAYTNWYIITLMLGCDDPLATQ